MSSGIYCIENIINRKKYIGQSQNIHKRTTSYNRGTPALNSAIKKYGKNNFKIKILVYCEKWELNRLEIECIKLYHSHVSENGYNIAWGGNAPMENRKHTEKSKQLMSKLRFGKNNPMFGKHLSEETKIKLSKATKGKILSEEHKNKISKANMGRGKGIILSEDTKKKMSESHKGKKIGIHLSNETKQKISDSRKGMLLSKETKEKISKALKGRPSPNKGKVPSEETRKKMSKSHMGNMNWKKRKNHIEIYTKSERNNLL